MYEEMFTISIFNVFIGSKKEENFAYPLQSTINSQITIILSQIYPSLWTFYWAVGYKETFCFQCSMPLSILSLGSQQQLDWNREAISSIHVPFTFIDACVLESVKWFSRNHYFFYKYDCWWWPIDGKGTLKLIPSAVTLNYFVRT